MRVKKEVIKFLFTIINSWWNTSKWGYSSPSIDPRWAESENWIEKWVYWQSQQGKSRYSAHCRYTFGKDHINAGWDGWDAEWNFSVKDATKC